MKKISHFAKAFSLSALLIACSDSTVGLKHQSQSSSFLEKIIISSSENLSAPKIEQEDAWYPAPAIPESSIRFHINAGHISEQGYIYFADSNEFISSEGTPRLGINADNPAGTGDDINIAKQRLIYHINYILRDDGTIKSSILDVFPYRAARRGFGFNSGSHKTPTGLYLLTPQAISPYLYGSINPEKGITSATMDMWNILDSQGNPIYAETRGANDPHNRMIIPHAYLGQNHQIYRDEGSMGCPHISSQDIQNMYNFVYENPNSYIYISGSCQEDLPYLERKISNIPH